MKKIITFFLLSLLCLSCGKRDEVLKLGVIFPLTGPVAEPGIKSLNGLKLAIKLYNNKKTDHQIELIVEDSQSDPKVGVLAINKLIAIDHVKIIIGDLMSSVSMAIGPIAQKNRIVLFAPGASNPSFTKIGNYIFRNWASDNYDGIVMSNYIKDTGFKSGAVIYVNNDYGVGLASAFKSHFSDLGGEIVLFEGYQQGENNFRKIISKLSISSKFQFIYLVGQPQENGLLVKQLIENGINSKIFGNLSVESPDFIKRIKKLPNPIIYSTPSYYPEKIIEGGYSFVERYKKQYGVEPDVVAAHAFDAGNITILALNNCNFDLEKFKNSLSLIKKFDGITGLTSFTKDGDVLKEVYIKEISQDGKVHIIKKYSPTNQ